MEAPSLWDIAGPNFTFDDAKSAIAAYNGCPGLLASEAQLAESFAEPTLTAPIAASRITLLDRQWAGRLGADPGYAAALSASVSDHASEITCIIAGLGEPGTIAKDRGAVIAAASALWPYFSLGFKNHYAFATKFLHWSAGRRNFPVMDSLARRGIRAFLKACGQGPARHGIRYDWVRPPMRDYADWITFYSQLIQATHAERQDALVCADVTTGGSRENTVLRALDKVFWEWGARAHRQS